MTTRRQGFGSVLAMTLPVVQAPIGSAATAELAAAVSGAGGLGMLAGSWASPGELRDRISQVRQLTNRPFGVNLVLQWPQEERLAAVLDSTVAVVSTAWGDPESLVERIHAAGALHVHSVGSAADAARAAAAGVDAVVAQGVEAGGHVPGLVSTVALVPAVVDAVAPLPVLAAGGVVDGRGLAAVLSLGAEAAWMGTRFVASSEADAHPDYQRRLVEAAESETVYSTVFDGGWPEAPHRTLNNSTLRAWAAAGHPATDRPGENTQMGRSSRGIMLKYSSDLPTRDTTGAVEAMALYAGQGVGVLRDVRPAAVIAQDVAREAKQILSRLAS